MTFNWLFFISALVLLLTPMGVFHGAKVRYRSIQQDWDEHWRQMLTLGQHSIDLARSALGGWLLVQSLALTVGSKIPWWEPLAIQACIVLVAVALQTRICKEERALNAPFAFLSGLVFGLYAPHIAGFSLLFAIVTAAGSRTASVFFPVLAVALLGLGTFFSGLKLTNDIIYGAVVIVLPWLWSLLFSRALVITYRARRPSKFA